MNPGGLGRAWAPVYDGAVPRLYSGQEAGVDIVFRTTHSNVSFIPFAVIDPIMP
jgi:hypothetical protein